MLLDQETELDVRLETRLPERLAIGAGNALFVYGSCFHRRQRVMDVRLIVDGRPVAPMAQRMPRLDLFRALHPTLDLATAAGVDQDPDSEDDPHLHCYRSGFWAILPLAASTGKPRAELTLVARLADGSEARSVLGAIELEAGPAIEPSAAERAREEEAEIAICMATYEPPIDLFRMQIESIRAQTHRRWTCLISDDRSSPSRLREMREVLGEDHRFVLQANRRRLGFYGNFERAMRMVPPGASLVTLVDQDDRWHPDKLEVLRDGLGDAQLVYSDARVVDPDGGVIADTYWTRRRNNHANLASLLIANTITGAASMFRRELLELVLPFPPRHGEAYHDHWLGLVALATGKVNYVDRPLYDYVQHGDAALGHSAANRGSGSRRRGLREALRGVRAWRGFFLGWRELYFYGHCRLALAARVLLLRCGDRMPWRKRRALRRYLSCEHSALGLGWLALRPARSWLGRNETMSAEHALLRGVAWRRIIAALTLRSGHPSRRMSNDASLPPERGSGSATRVRVVHPSYARLSQAIAPLELDVREDAPTRTNVLIPTIDARHFFGGYITKFNLARKLAEQGLRTRIVTVDPTGPLPRGWQQQIESYSGLDGVFSEAGVEVAFARDRDLPLEVSPSDRMVATTWWSAHAAHHAAKALGRKRFVYLVQEYEPYLFGMGAAAAMARQSYEFPHFAVFSTELLRDFFRQRQIGVFAEGTDGEQDSIAFENAITAIDPPSAAELSGRSSRRLLFYARPEPHAMRNMFELGLMALADSVAGGVFGPEWQFNGIGTVARGSRIELAEGVGLELVPRAAQGGYGEFLRTHDVGLALMMAPHPSLVPIEMASAGMLTVTNSFETKTPEAMRRISTNLVTVEPTLEGIQDGLREAVTRTEGYESRARGAAVAWSRDWSTSLDPRVMQRVTAFLAAG